MSTPTAPDMTAIVTGHHEGPMIGPTLRSLFDCVAAARAAGIEVEVLAFLDDADAATKEAFADAEELGCEIHEVAYGDHAQVRNHAVELARGAYIAFLDGDDLWTENWLVDAYRTCASDPGRVIAHPEVNWIFDNDSNLWFHIDQTDPAFDPAYLRVFNYWDVLCLAPRAAYVDHPRAKRRIDAGFAFDDWDWNLQTVGAGYQHRVVAETVHFKRRRTTSQLTVALGNRSLPPDRPLLTYAGMEEWERTHGPGTA